MLYEGLHKAAIAAPHVRVWEIQYDGAGAHGSNTLQSKADMEKRLAASFAAKMREDKKRMWPRGVRVVFVCQPGRSPDFNLLDAGGWVRVLVLQHDCLCLLTPVLCVCS